MGFSGDLGDIGLADVFQNITSNRLAGTLTVRNDRRTLHVYFRDGKLTLATTRSRDPGQGRPAPGGGGPTSVEDDVREAVYEAFCWTTCRFEFEHGPPIDGVFPDAQVHAGVSLEAEPILLEAARRTDEWQRILTIIGSTEEVFRRVDDAGAAPSEGVASAVFAVTDGRTGLRTMVDRVSHGWLQVCAATADLVSAGLVRPLSADERLCLAETLLEESDGERAANAVEGLMDSDDPSIHAAIGEVFSRTRRTEDAARSFAFAGAAYLDAGDDAEGLVCLERAADEAPDDADLRERLLTRHLERDDVARARLVGLELAEIYHRLGLEPQVRATFARLVKATRGEPALVEQLAACEHELGNDREAVKLYRSLARKALKGQRFEYARKLMRKILAIQPDDREAAHDLETLESGEHAARRFRNRRLRQITMWSVSAILLLHVVVYESLARARLASVRERSTTLVTEGRFLEAVHECTALRDAFPWSLTRIEAGILAEELARSQLNAIAATASGENPATAMIELDRILALAVSEDVHDRARILQARLQAEARVHAHARALTEGRNAESAAALLSVRDPKTVKALERLLTHPDPGVRKLALEPLREMGSHRSIPRIIELLRDPDPEVRRLAFTSLVALTGHDTRDDRHGYWLEWWRSEGEEKLAPIIE